jgi:lipoprotein NlpI
MKLNRAAMTGLMLALLAGCASKPEAPDPVAEMASADAAMQEAVNPYKGEFEAAVKLMQEGKVDDAKTRLLAIHKKAPNLTGPMLNLALIAAQKKQRDGAREWLDKVLTVVPNHPVALTYSGLIAREDGMFSLAEQQYRKALKAHPDYAPAIRNLAILLDMYRGKPAEALPYYERYQALQKTPDPQVNDWIFDVKQRLEAQP